MKWDMVELGEVIKIIGGYAFKSDDLSQNGDGVIRISNLTNTIVNIENAVKIHPDKTQKLEKLKTNDILIAMSGATTGKIGIMPATLTNNFYLNQRVGKYQIIDENNFFYKYLFYFLKAPYSQLQIKNYAAGCAQPNISPKQLESIKIPLPPLEIQEKIAAILDRGDRLVELRKAALEKLEQLGRSLFIEMFGDPVTNPKGWKIGKIKDLVDEVKYGTSQKCTDKGFYAILRMNNLTYSGRMDYSNLKYIDLNEKDQKKYLVQKNDLLFNRTNSQKLVGKTAVYNLDQSMALAGYLLRVRCNKNANPNYISFYLNSYYGKAILKNMCKQIIGMANINAQEFQSIKIPLPPIALQQKFAERIAKLEAQRASREKALEGQQQLFQSLMQRVFKGELNLS